MEKENISGAVLQRDKKSYAIVPKITTGLLTADHLEKIASVVRKYEIPMVKITSGQRIALIGMNEDQLPKIWTELDMNQGHLKTSELCLHYVQACPGTETCKYGMQDSMGLARELDELFSNMDQPAKLKIGVSGCPFCCGESFVRDIGLFAKKTGWTLILGGCSARKPRIGDIIAEDITKENAIEIINRFLIYYNKNANRRERTSRFIERVGIAQVKLNVLGSQS